MGPLIGLLNFDKFSSIEESDNAFCSFQREGDCQWPFVYLQFIHSFIHSSSIFIQHLLSARHCATNVIQSDMTSALIEFIV